MPIDLTLPWQVIHADCLDVLRELPDGCVDAVVTDPPYGIGKDGQKQSTGGHGGRKAYDFLGWDRERPSGEAFAHILRLAPQAIVWGGNYFVDFLPPTSGWLVWDKGQRINQSDGELAWTTRAGALRIFTLNRVALMTDGAEHPTQKPVELMKWCLGLLDPAPDSLIIDPYCGSGTTGVAALQLGYRFLGIEREVSYVEIARRRIADAAAQGNLFQTA